MMCEPEKIVGRGGIAGLKILKSEETLEKRYFVLYFLL